MKSPTVSVILATLNEEGSIEHVMDTALNNDYVTEFIIADGGSTDSTRERILARGENDERVTLIHNHERVQSAGLNMAAWAATGDLLIRLDGHTRYADDYVSASIAASGKGLAVGGPLIAEGVTRWERACANAMGDPLAIGPARFHHAETVEEVDTVYLGTFERGAFIEIGGYRTFPSGTVEDTDFYQRWRSTRRCVIVDPSIRSWYMPRGSLRALWRQFYRYGRGKAELIWLNGRLPSLRPLAPTALTAGFAASLVLGVTLTWIPSLVLTAVWFSALGVVALRSGSQRLLTGVATGSMHIAYGVGLWLGLLSGRPDVRTLGDGFNN